MRILLYESENTVSKLYSLHRMFNDYVLPGTGIEVVRVNQHSLQQELTEDARILVLPGARESSAYRNELAGEKFNKLSRRIDGGMHVLGICAGAYVLAREFDFNVYDEGSGKLLEQRHIRSNLGLADIKAFGPDMRLYTPRPREEGNPWSVYSLADVSFEGRNGLTTAPLAISRAPSFGEPLSGQCTVMARYAATGDAAIVRFTQGQGGGVLVGPAFEVGGRNLQHYVHPRHANDLHSQSIMQRLSEAAPAWSELVHQTFQTLLPGEEKVHRQIARNLRRGLALPSAVRMAVRAQSGPHV